MQKKFVLPALSMLFAVQALAPAGQASPLEELQKKADQLKAAGYDNQKAKVTYCVTPIKKGVAVSANQVEEREIAAKQIPADCAMSAAAVIGQKPSFDIEIGQLVSQRDFGRPMTAQQNAAMLARNWSGSKLPMGTVVVNTSALVKGTTISSTQLSDVSMPASLIPQDALSSASLAAGRVAKFDKPKLQILMQHELAVGR